MKDISLAIAQRRIELGLTQSQLGELIGADQSKIAWWETRRSRPSYEAIFVLCDALQTTPNYLFGFEGE